MYIKSGELKSFEIYISGYPSLLKSEATIPKVNPKLLIPDSSVTSTK
jgi:hypothetical protein